MIERVLASVVAKYVCGKLVVQSVLVAVAGKYVCGKLVLRMELVAVVANVVNSICDYLVINRCCFYSVYDYMAINVFYPIWSSIISDKCIVTQCSFWIPRTPAKFYLLFHALLINCGRIQLYYESPSLKYPSRAPAMFSDHRLMRRTYPHK